MFSISLGVHDRELHYRKLFWIKTNLTAFDFCLTEVCYIIYLEKNGRLLKKVCSEVKIGVNKLCGNVFLMTFQLLVKNAL